MHINEPLYEKLPYLYMLFGISIFFYSTDLVAVIAAVVLYFAGCVIAVMRSNYRRRTPAKQTISGVRLPFWVYELYPFVFIGVAMGLVRYLPRAETVALAIVLIMFSLKNLMLRRQHRFKKARFNNAKSKL